MKSKSWFKFFPGAITATDADGVITDMNDVAADMYRKDGGYELLGQSAIACHPEPSLTKVQKLYADQALNVYTISKHGRKKLIYQAPYFVDGAFAGFVEMNLELPDNIPHFNRD